MTIHTAIPVICDRCRLEGSAGGDGFADIRDLLAFEPVQRRAHVNNWTAEHQRAFIAGLAITGSPRQAARAIGRHAFGAEQLRTAKGGRSFADAWDGALELARERELARMHENLHALAAQTAQSAPMRQDMDDGTDDADRRDYVEGMLRIRKRLTKARRLLLMAIAQTAALRGAWEALVGATDWDKAKRGEAQDDEPFCDPEDPERGMPRFRNAGPLILAESGLLAEFTGGPDAMKEIRDGVASIKAARLPAPSGEGSGGGDCLHQPAKKSKRKKT